MRKLAFTLAACLLTAVPSAAQEQPPQPSQQQPPPPVVVTVKPAGPTAPSGAAGGGTAERQVISDEIFGRELKDMDGQSFRLSGFRGRVFVVNVWATWCGPCRMEIPELVRLHEEFSERGVEFVGLTTEDPATDAERVRDFVTQFGMRYKLGWADHDTALALLAGRSSIPQTLVVAPDGHIAARFRGYSPRLPPMLRAAIEKALEPAPPAETLPPPRP